MGLHSSSMRRAVDAKVWLTRQFPLLRGITLARAGLTDVGWYRSVVEGFPVDKAGEPIIWLTYAAIYLLRDRTPANARVFEYGSGHSTLWWSERVREVVACEHHEEWAQRISATARDNVTVLHRELGQGYVEAAPELGPFHVVVIDGRHRVACVEPATRALADDGVVVWDNTDRQKYRAAFGILHDGGFRHIDLWGLSPGADDFGCTSIFYRDANCLGL